MLWKLRQGSPGLVPWIVDNNSWGWDDTDDNCLQIPEKLCDNNVGNGERDPNVTCPRLSKNKCGVGADTLTSEPSFCYRVEADFLLTSWLL